MAFTSQLGTNSSQLGNVEPGQGAVELAKQRGGAGSDQLQAYGDIAPAPALLGSGSADPPHYSVVQSNSTNSTTTITFGATPTAGNAVIVAGGISALSDNQGNTYTQYVAAGAAGTSCSIWYCFNVASSGTFTLTATLVGNGDWVACEVKGLGSNPTKASTTTTTGDLSHETLTLSAPADHQAFLISVTACSTTFSVTSLEVESPPWNTILNTGGFGTYAVQRVMNHGEAPTVTYTWGGGTTYAGCIASFFNPQDVVGASAGTGTASGAALAIFEGGDILLETGDKLLLETGDFALLESTANGGVAQSNGTSTATGVGVALLASAGSSAGVGTASGVGIALGNTTGTGTETAPAPSFSGTGATGVQGTGTFTAPVPGLDSGYLRLTQEARNTVFAESAPKARLTQLARSVSFAETGAKPLVRLTQMARQVLYPFTCGSGPVTPPDTLPPLIDHPVVHIARDTIWALERFDLKHRDEDTYSSSEQTNTNPPSWTDDGTRWMLQRFDMNPRTEGTLAATPLVTNTAAETQWALARFDIHNRDEDTA